MKVKLSNRALTDALLVREPVPGDRRGAEFWIAHSGMRDSWLALIADTELAELLPTLREHVDPDSLNGYVAFPKRRAPRIPKNSTRELLQFIPVHGGVTWALKDEYMAVWGFDTMHHNSPRQPRTDRDWIRANCWVLYRGLLLAERHWPEYRRATNARKIEIADEMLALVDEQPLLEKLGLEAMLGILSGRVLDAK